MGFPNSTNQRFPWSLLTIVSLTTTIRCIELSSSSSVEGGRLPAVTIVFRLFRCAPMFPSSRLSCDSFICVNPLDLAVFRFRDDIEASVPPLSHIEFPDVLVEKTLSKRGRSSGQLDIIMAMPTSPAPYIVVCTAVYDKSLNSICKAV